MPQPLTSIIPPGIWWVRDVAHAAEKKFIGMPGDKTKPKQFWRDDSLVAGGGWFAALMGASQSYKMLARDASGKPLLTPITSNTFYNCYSLTAVRLYEQYAFMFRAGVPYLVDVAVPTAEASEPNFVGTDPARDYPLTLGANHMLVAVGDDVQVWDIEEFAKANRVPPQVTPEQRVQMISAVCASNSPAVDKLQQIRALVTISGNGIYQTT